MMVIKLQEMVVQLLVHWNAEMEFLILTCNNVMMEIMLMEMDVVPLVRRKMLHLHFP